MYGEHIKTPTDKILDYRYKKFEKRIDSQMAELANEFIRQIVVLKDRIKELEVKLESK